MDQLYDVKSLYLWPILIALFDVIENLIMLKVSDGLTSNVWFTIARISTVGKFGLIALGMGHAIFGLLAWVCLRWLSFSTRV